MLLLSAFLALASADSYLGREIATTMHWLGAEWLIRAEREAEEHVTLLIDLLEIEAGQTVCDLGSGNGALTLPIAEEVGPEGGVLAVDIQPQMLELLQERARTKEIDNIVTCLGSQKSFPVEPGSLDLVLMVDVYHELSEPAPMLQHLARSLTPEGLVCLAEYRLEDPRVPIKRLHKMSQAQVVRELAENGYRFVRGSARLPRQHLLFFGTGLFAADSEGAEREAAIRLEMSRALARAWQSGDERNLLPFYAEEVQVSEQGIERRRDREDLLRDGLAALVPRPRTPASGQEGSGQDGLRWTARAVQAPDSGFFLQANGRTRLQVHWERDDSRALHVVAQNLFQEE